MNPTIDDIRSAAIGLKGLSVRTPLLENPFVNERIGGRLLVKAEPLQRTGSFKFRGAYNTISNYAQAGDLSAVVAYSSGNHAQGVAAAAALLGVPAVIVMPADAPGIKVEKTRAYGAEVVTYDRYGESREDIAAAIADERGATLIKPYDDPRIISGQGTVGLELTEQAADQGVEKIDAVLSPCGGGGLVSGIAIAVKAADEGTSVYSVEPAGFDDTARSLAGGRRVGVDPAARSICDALLAPMPGEMTFAINQELLEGGLSVTDEEAKDAMRLAFREFKLVVEPGGAVALAAVLTGKVDCRSKTACVVCSGGNVDGDLYADVLGGG